MKEPFWLFCIMRQVITTSSQQSWKTTIPAPLNSTHHTVNVKGLWYFSADLDVDEWGRKEGKKTDGPYYLLQGGKGGATCLLSNS